MNSINTFLLSVLGKNERFGQDISSLHRRYQNLSLIYVNIALTSISIIFNTYNGLYYKDSIYLLHLFTCFTLSFASFAFLKAKNLTASCFALLLEMHVGNVIATYIFNCPLICAFGGVLHLGLIFSITSSFYLQMLNLILCYLEYYCNFTILLDMYKVTLTMEQKLQIDFLFPTAIYCLFVAGIMMIVQKKIEGEIWGIAKENYSKSENLTKELVQAMEAKDTFISTLSHEIRNPLNALKGSIDYLQAVVKNSDYLQVLKNAKMSGDILLNLVNNVLDAAKFKSDKMEIACLETDVVETVKKVLTINSEKLREKEITAKAFLDDRIPDLLWTDPARLLQILMNLVSNAVKFTPKRGRIHIYLSWCESNSTKEELLAPFDNSFSQEISAEIITRQSLETGKLQRGSSYSKFDEFSFEEEAQYQKNIQYLSRSFEQSRNDLSTLSNARGESLGEFWSLVRLPFNQQEENNSNLLLANLDTSSKRTGFLKIQITDTGCGIEEKSLNKLFGMFQQTSSGMRSCDGGTGLGLWICKQLCQKMNGDITVYSKEGQGSSFVLFIPIDNNSIRIKRIQSSAVIRRHKLKALVVDDYAVNRYLHKLLLEQEGTDVILANDGKDALERYKMNQENPFDFILLDVHMPVMDGFTSAKLIREWERENNLKKVDIYFVSGEYFDKEEVLHKFKLQGGSEDGIKCLKKPLDGDVLKKIMLQYKMQSPPES